VRIPGSGRYTTLLVPDAAVGADQNIRYLAAIDKDNVARIKPVGLGALFGQLRSIESGIEETDRIVINGMVKVRPNIKVVPVDKPIDPAAFHLTAPGSATTQALPQTRPATAPSPSTRAATTALGKEAP
jgi:hypothetical protein